MRPTLTTPRLTLVPMTAEHLPALVELDGDPEVMRYLLGRARTTHEAREHWAPFCDGTAADAFGLGFWAGLLDGGFAGWWGASPPVPITSSPTTADVGWRLRRDRWGAGLATEGARAVVEHCFATVGLTRVTAETMAVNGPSRGVMRKLGMRHVRTEVRDWDDPLPGAEEGEVVYELTRRQWLAGEPGAG